MADILTDTELRKALIKYGQNVGPITDSTRNLYKKKLGKLIATENTPSILPQSQPYSARRSISARAKRASTQPEPVSIHAKTNGASFSDEEDSKSESIPTTRRKSSRVQKPSSTQPSTQNGIETKTRPRRSMPANYTPVRSSLSRAVRHRTPQSYSDDSDSEISELQTNVIQRCLTPKYSSTPISPQLSNKINFDRKNELSDNHIENKHEPKIKTNTELDSHSDSTPLRGTIFSNGDRLFNRKNLQKQNIENWKQSIVTQAMEENTTVQKKRQSWLNNVSSFLPIATALFFVILGLLYATMCLDNTAMELSLLPSSNQHIDMVHNETHSVLLLAHEIYEHVATFAGNKICSEEEEKLHMKVDELVADMKISGGFSNKTFQSCLKKFMNMEDWGVFIYNEAMEPMKGNDELQDVFFIETSYPLLTGWCRFKRAVIKVMFRILLLTAAAILIWGLIEYRKYRKKHAHEEKQAMYMMVQKILDVLQRHHERSLEDESIEPFIAIPHVRDMIIQPKDRKKLNNIWVRAKRFLSANESRIRVENQRIAGEDFLVWRWIQVGSPANKLGSTAREWQGEAFDQNKSVNTLVNSPTPCLKVRNMFNVDCEKSEGWEQQIQDSILEKCTGNNEILHIFVEKTSKEGLVYIKCMTNAAAGRVFKSLHGAWFDARLVTVKFIRLSRFHQRFPDTITAPQVPMKPSSKSPVSKFKPTPSENFDKIYPSLS